MCAHVSVFVCIRLRYYESTYKCGAACHAPVASNQTKCVGSLNIASASRATLTSEMVARLYLWSSTCDLACARCITRVQMKT